MRVLGRFCSVINMFFMFDHCGKGLNLLLKFVFCMVFFPCSFHIILALDEVVVEALVSVGVFKLYFCSF